MASVASQLIDEVTAHAQDRGCARDMRRRYLLSELPTYIRISEQAACYAFYTKTLRLFVIEMQSVYCAVRNGSLNRRDYVSHFKC